MAKFGFERTTDEAAVALSAHINGKTVIITAVTPGRLGTDTARALAQHDPALLILASRSEDKILKVIDDLKASVATTVRPLELDLASLKSVRAAASKVLEWTTSVDAVIETAGVMAVPEFKKSEDGVEMTFAVNHLGHFLLTNLILPSLLAAKGGARVVPFSSDAHNQAVLNLDDVTFKNGQSYNKWWAYGNSKAANILFAIGLAERFGPRGLQAFSVDPGVIVTTSLTRSIPQEEFKALGCVDDQGNLNTAAFTPKSAAQGSATGIIAAFDPSIAAQSGSIMQIGIVNKDAAAPYAMEKASADKLWELSERLVGQKFSEVSTYSTRNKVLRLWGAPGS